MYKTILVATDLSHPKLCRKTLGVARQIGGNQSRIIALYVAADIPPYVAAELPEGLLHKNVARARAEVKALADEAGAESEVLSGHPSLRILEYSKDIGADLIVIASHRPGLQDYFLGSTAARVVRHAECAVLVDR
jgi:nucleotide-binding universal stress UspA family protein